MARIVNGIDVERFKSVLDSLRTTPELGRFTFRAVSDWQNGAHSITSFKSFYGLQQEREHAREHRIGADEPDELLGTDHAPNPTEALLHALANCVSTTFVLVASAHGMKIESLSVRLEGDLDVRAFTGVTDDVRPGFLEIRYFYDARTDAPEDKVRELFDWAVRHSPVADSVKHGVNVTVQPESPGEARARG